MPASTKFANEALRLSQLRDISHDFQDLLERKGTEKLVQMTQSKDDSFVYFILQKLTPF